MCTIYLVLFTIYIYLFISAYNLSILCIGIVKSRSGKRIDVSFINFSPDVTEVLQLLQSCKISLTITTLPLSITTKKQFGLDVKRTKCKLNNRMYGRLKSVPNAACESDSLP